MTQATNDLRQDALAIFQAGIQAADPYSAVKRCLQSDGEQLDIALDLDNRAKRSGNWQKIYVIAFGKAACSMAKAAQEIIPAQLLAQPILAITNYENVTELANIEILGANHPLPDQAGFVAAQRIAKIAQQAQQGELVLALVSGGGSALIPLPADGISLNEKIATTDLLLASGATINEINCVRKHLSQIKGGGLAKFTAPADLHALILSDVLSDELSDIASGPTIADDTTFNDAIQVFKDKNIWHKITQNVQTHLENGAQGIISETAKTGDAIFNNTGHTLCGSNTISLQATSQMAQNLAYDLHLYSDQLSGEAKHIAEDLVIYAQALLSSGINKPNAILAGGETTVTITGTGLGGRNQEMALAFAIAAEKHQLNANWVFLSGGTDGRDGPTDAAGGIVDQQTIARMRNATIEPKQYLANNDAYHALQISEDLLITGATGTNVADLQILLIQPQLT
ncbi:glycerate kinase type-2 family protein [methanotrophic endosymbiont of Bathymodiolus puteoserpentis (Logatchev)]|jgi:hydroxypyruvate reductase|uniref:glycerate kinase type-2 family protein n=1 Tax=methanotrophic endosymbiont of Bathymodiolus puteoserpentis (Logatchev) TaxID=343235 RepID=UPI0013CAA031|nr:glycerate kinase [methanotrophic endosymbiont of Bathymodiolus puteoserpentis (Logatchev)]SHE23508.1 D-glycerate 2-kinase [methanotrophic endosymbiont of Bathymodiolus puteoserpentis (Logatchev)]